MKCAELKALGGVSAQVNEGEVKFATMHAA